MLAIKAKSNGEVTIKMRGSADDVLAELGAVASKMNRLARDLRTVSDRLCSDGVKIEMPEPRSKSSRGQNPVPA